MSRLPGASTAAVHRLDMADRSKLVLRRYVWTRYLTEEPDAPAREADGMRFALSHGVPVPEPIVWDTTGDDVGDGTPALLMTLLAGSPVAVPDLGSLAAVAAGIHAIGADDLGHDYFPWYLDEMTAPPPLSRRPAVWERAIELWIDAAPRYRPAFVHRDFHPGNVLWARGRCTGVVDWANSCRGPVGCDLAHCRANLRELSGPDAADVFVAAYEAITGEALHPYWVMAAILEHDHDHWTSDRLAVAEPDLALAVAALG